MDSASDTPLGLSMEQEFSLQFFTSQVAKMDQLQAQELLICLYKQMMIKDMMYKHFLSHRWNFDDGLGN
ncbi:MAG TPA: NblA/ycf18 family protein [Candidatus Caenarcaniphilales bacterium]